jgi:hypothetical protein
MQKNHIGKILTIWIIVFFIGMAVAQENVSIKNIKSSLEVIIDVTGNGKTFHITTSLRNIGNKNETVWMICQPGGGFEIYNQSDELVYNSPKLVWWIMWNLSLEPNQTEEIFNETWKGVDNNWSKLPNGKYSVRGVVFSDDGDIFSDPADIHLERAKIRTITDFLERFPILLRLLNLI